MKVIPITFTVLSLYSLLLAICTINCIDNASKLINLILGTDYE